MADALGHRGPDDSGIAILPRVGGSPGGAFGHRRLSILDLSSAGHQPMETADARFILVYNGEIYNFRELRAGLEREGVGFRGHSDTEVLLVGWARHGLAFVERMRGMFAFAVWNRDSGVGWLVRDPFGIKPLYVAQAGGDVLFASEVRALLASGRVERSICPAAVASYLATGSVIEPSSIIQGVECVPAGFAVPARVAGAQVTLGTPVRYSGEILPTADVPRKRDVARAARRVREVLRDSVATHMVSDVPVGFFLSGGIDSSAVVALASEVSTGPLETFTVTFAEQRFNEAAPASAVARRYGTRHHAIPLSGADVLTALPAACAAMDQPSIDGINTYVVSRAVREHGLKVVLSGLGGDEFFAGYPSFQRASQFASLWHLPRALRKTAAAGAARIGGIRGGKIALLLGEQSPAAAAYRASRVLFADPQIRELTGHAFHNGKDTPPAGLTLLQQVSWYEAVGYMRNTLLRDSDVFSMAHGLELRVPLVDREVAAVVTEMEDSLKLSRGVSKPLLLSAVRDLLPREVWDRPKQGFTLPFERWMRDELRQEVGRTFSASRLERVGLDTAATHGVWSDFLGRRAGMGWARPWALYTLVRWSEQNDVALGTRSHTIKTDSLAEVA